VDPCIELAASVLATPSTPIQTGLTTKGSKGKTVLRKRSKELKKPETRSQQAAELLKVVPPDFAFDGTRENARVTWLGHAGVLVQIPPLSSDGARPIRCVFDPIFSQRASPTQGAGPTRYYAAPCKVEDLPEIDLFFCSHSHYDHLDYETVMALWRMNKDTIRFIVPLGNRQWFVDSGITEGRVHELDWWDTIYLSLKPEVPEERCLKVVCTPSQHQSGRSGLDTDMTLWSSWFVQHPMHAETTPYRVFFAGDTGYQFHASPQWPPSPPSSSSSSSSSPTTATTPPKQAVLATGEVADNPKYTTYPTCPAFQDIVDALGATDLLILPIWVGGTYDFVRSLVPVSDALSPFPRHKLGLTAANHMPPWDAVRVLKLMTKGKEGKKGLDSSRRRAPVAVAMHWGTFITEPVEVLKTLGQLQWACEQQGVRFAREMDGDGGEAETTFLALNHGQSVTL